jgi:hypothetical protein
MTDGHSDLRKYFPLEIKSIKLKSETKEVKKRIGRTTEKIKIIIEMQQYGSMIKNILQENKERTNQKQSQEVNRKLICDTIE